MLLGLTIYSFTERSRGGKSRDFEKNHKNPLYMTVSFSPNNSGSLAKFRSTSSNKEHKMVTLKSLIKELSLGI